MLANNLPYNNPLLTKVVFLYAVLFRLAQVLFILSRIVFCHPLLKAQYFSVMLSCHFQNTSLGKIVFEGDPIEFDDPNQRNLMAEVSTKVNRMPRLIIHYSKNIYVEIRTERMRNMFLS